MTKIRATLQEKHRICCEAEGFGAQVQTDVAKQYGGHGEHMGPTELVAAGLGACILVMMGLKAKQLGLDLSGAVAEVDKQLVSDPLLRIGSLTVCIRVPIRPDEATIAKLEEAGRHCPVHLSFASQVRQTILFEWGV